MFVKENPDRKNNNNINSFDLNFVILLGHFNTKSKSWSVNDTTTEEGTILENLTFLYGMKKLISAPKHILEHSSGCIGLLYVNQPNLVIDSGIHPSLHQNCHNRVIFCKLNLEIEYLPPYTHEAWDYGKTQTDLIVQLISLTGLTYF